MAVTDSANKQLSLGGAQALTGELVALIERDRLSVAQAARSAGVPVAVASRLVQLHAIELEAADTELAERLEDIERQCPGEDWWSYSNRQHNAIFEGSAIPNRIVRELIEAWQQRTEQGTGTLAANLGIGDEALRRSLGMVDVPRRVKYGRRYPARRQKTITVEAASRIVRALGIPPCEVCGL
ncbi:MAG: hypothetical protein JO168_10815 [Solirubrobacterales bacterium]|nr:hypothetical protein [Solirubrobacterales bacterium]